MTRRDVLQLAVALTAQQGLAEIVRTFVLVPGAWHGAWAFERVAPLLEKAGHRVDAVTLPGLAERKAELTPSLHLADHVSEVVKRVERASGTVVLVGHSYAGVVVMPAAAKVKDRLERLVLLDAFLAEPGKSMLAQMNQKYSDSWRAKAKAVSNGLFVPPMLDAKAMGISTPKDVAWVDGKLTPHPMATLEEPAEFDASALASIPRRYVWCAKYPGFKRYADQAKAQGWEVRSLDAGHDAMITHPAELVAAIS